MAPVLLAEELLLEADPEETPTLLVVEELLETPMLELLLLLFTGIFRVTLEVVPVTEVLCLVVEVLCVVVTEDGLYVELEFVEDVVALGADAELLADTEVVADAELLADDTVWTLLTVLPLLFAPLLLALPVVEELLAAGVVTVLLLTLLTVLLAVLVPVTAVVVVLPEPVFVVTLVATLPLSLL